MANAMASSSSVLGEVAGMLDDATTVMADVLELLPGFGSVLAVVAVAVFETGPAVEGSVMVRLIVAEPRLLIVPRLQVTVVVPLQLP